MRLSRPVVGGVTIAAIAVGIVAYFMVKYWQRVSALHGYQENVPGETSAMLVFGLLATCVPAGLVGFLVGRWVFSD